MADYDRFQGLVDFLGDAGTYLNYAAQDLNSFGGSIESVPVLGSAVAILVYSAAEFMATAANKLIHAGGAALEYRNAVAELFSGERIFQWIEDTYPYVYYFFVGPLYFLWHYLQNEMPDLWDSICGYVNWGNYSFYGLIDLFVGFLRYPGTVVSQLFEDWGIDISGIIANPRQWLLDLLEQHFNLMYHFFNYDFQRLWLYLLWQAQYYWPGNKSQLQDLSASLLRYLIEGVWAP